MRNIPAAISGSVVPAGLNIPKKPSARKPECVLSKRQQKRLMIARLLEAYRKGNVNATAESVNTDGSLSSVTDGSKIKKPKTASDYARYEREKIRNKKRYRGRIAAEEAREEAEERAYFEQMGVDYDLMGIKEEFRQEKSSYMKTDGFWA